MIIRNPLKILVAILSGAFLFASNASADDPRVLKMVFVPASEKGDAEGR